jgi:hypothetical protein
MKKLALRALQSLGLLAVVWIISWKFLGANAALGVVLVLVVAGVIGTLVTLD